MIYSGRQGRLPTHGQAGSQRFSGIGMGHHQKVRPGLLEGIQQNRRMNMGLKGIHDRIVRHQDQGRSVISQTGCVLLRNTTAQNNGKILHPLRCPSLHGKRNGFKSALLELAILLFGVNQYFHIRNIFGVLKNFGLLAQGLNERVHLISCKITTGLSSRGQGMAQQG